jgi:predicted unusual protein kinase regulating ubiquinone biosynthesis (AarF/ABC1/UbiB family)
MRVLPAATAADFGRVRSREVLARAGLRGWLRVVRILWSVLRLWLVIWWQSRHQLPVELAERLQGAQLRRELISLGPTFIKIGQMLSTRVDLLPVAYIEELRSLLDRVPPYPTDQAFAILEHELRRPIAEVYESIDVTPIAAASIGQVYRARVAGRDVVVKIQRPDLAARIALDLAALRRLAPWLARVRSMKAVDWNGVIDEFDAMIHEEIDYCREVENAEQFRRNFMEWREVYVPAILHNLSTRRVITMEYIPGVKVDDRAGLARLGLTPLGIVERLTRTYLKQLLEDGFFHADPHPGNLRVMPDGRLAFLDFGMAGRISAELQGQLVDTFFHIAERDWRAVLRDAARLGFLRIDPADERTLDQVGQRLLTKYAGVRVGDLAFGELSEDLAEMLYTFPFQIPSRFTYILRALTTIEGIGTRVDPTFNFFATARPYAKEFMLRREGRSFGGKILSRVLRKDDGGIDWAKAWKLARMAWNHYVGRG